MYSRKLRRSSDLIHKYHNYICFYESSYKDITGYLQAWTVHSGVQQSQRSFIFLFYWRTQHGHQLGSALLSGFAGGFILEFLRREAFLNRACDACLVVPGEAVVAPAVAAVRDAQGNALLRNRVIRDASKSSSITTTTSLHLYPTCQAQGNDLGLVCDGTHKSVFNVCCYFIICLFTHVSIEIRVNQTQFTYTFFLFSLYHSIFISLNYKQFHATNVSPCICI